MNRIAFLLPLLFASAAVAQTDIYTITEDQASAGSSVKRRLVAWPVPINRKYAELSAADKELVRKAYAGEPAMDEPPYPAAGMQPMLQQIAQILRFDLGEGTVRARVAVDESGVAQSIAVSSSPNDAVTKLVAHVLLAEKYKPAICEGKPCSRDYLFEFGFVRNMAPGIGNSQRPPPR